MSLEDPVVGRRGRCLSRGQPSDYKENVTMNEQKIELFDKRSKEKMKRAKKYERRIKDKKGEKDYKTSSK
jgi:hypothetical protein